MAKLTPEAIAKAGTEHAEQSAFFHWAAIQGQVDPRLKLMFAIPNGGLRTKRTASRLRAEGAKAGVLDIMFPVASRGYHGMFIEMKIEMYRNHEGGGCSDKQLQWIDDLRAQGYHCVVAYSWLDAATHLCEYLQPEA